MNDSKKKITETPWEIQENESSKAFQAFQTYLFLGEERSIVKVSKKLGKSETIITRWSSKYNWVERVRAYDNDNAIKTKKQTEKAIKEMSERQIKTAMLLQSKGLESLKYINPEKISAKDAKELIKLGIEIERLNRLPEKSETSESLVNINLQTDEQKVVVYLPEPPDFDSENEVN
jgi:hypothetical protein